MIAPFPGFEFDLGFESIASFIIKLILLIAFLGFVCWIYRNDFHGHKYFRDCICPDCHDNMTKLYFSLDPNPNDKDDYIIYRCKCGFRSSAFLCSLYDKALYHYLQDYYANLKEKRKNERG